MESLITFLTDRVYEKVFNSEIEELKNYNKIKELKKHIELYFSKNFENIDRKHEFDFQAVTDFLLNSYDSRIKPMFYLNSNKFENQQSARDALINEAINRGNGNPVEIEKYCNTFIDFCSYQFTEDISPDTAFSISAIYNYIDTKIEEIKSVISYATENIKTENTLSNLNDNIDQKIWNSSKRSYEESHGKINHKIGRFKHLNILQNLLPKGYVDESSFEVKGKNEKGEINTLINLVKENNEDIVIIGEGGIGKTTFLQHIMEQFYESNSTNYASCVQIPIFIELNRCPETILDWYDKKLNKTNFVTRYIATLLENHQTLDSVSYDILEKIEKEFQKTSENGIPKYILLLDGFNEVKITNGQSVRRLLSNEILKLHNCNNVRIISTSRETQAANFASEFKNIKLTGLDKNDIINHLKNKNFSIVDINNVLSCKNLLNCLKIPLYLCMFSYEKQDNLVLPETAGEILYFFFHKESKFYNTKKHCDEIEFNLLSKKQTILIIDFILPYIGYVFEKKALFSVNESELKGIIDESLLSIKNILTNLTNIPYPDFDYKSDTLLNTVNYFINLEDKKRCDIIINCIYSYLGVIYRYEVFNNKDNEHYQYSFIHHHFRDYFSAMWNVQLLSLCKYIELNNPDYNKIKSIINSEQISMLNEGYWSVQKIEFIAEILMEHRNKPILNPNTSNWVLPKTIFAEQSVLINSLDFCRITYNSDLSLKYLCHNILDTILYGRKELSGLNLSKLDLREYCLFNVNCSRKGKTKQLTANFSNSQLSEKTFTPKDHKNTVIDYVYSDDCCFTLDDTGLIKCWDLNSEKIKFELQSNDPIGFHDFNATGNIKISSDQRWLAARIQLSSSSGMKVYVNVFDLNNPKKAPIKLIPSSKHSKLNEFCFTNDSKGIICVCDNNEIYGFSIESKILVYNFHSCLLLNKSQIYSDSLKSIIFAFTNNYSIDYFDSIDNEEQSEESITYCMFCKIDVNKKEEESLYEFLGSHYTSPVSEYISNIQSFLFFNADTDRIEKFDCRLKQIEPVFEELILDHKKRDYDYVSPDAIYINPQNVNECYIMFRDCCYKVNICDLEYEEILDKYEIANVNNIFKSENDEKLNFNVSVIPHNNFFIIGNDDNTYEWNVENDTISRKYNIAFYDSIGMFFDKQNKSYILAHHYNGINVFSSNSLNLKNCICYNEHDYHAEICSYSATKQLLAIAHVRSDKEKVMLYNLSNSSTLEIFSTIEKNESIISMCFDKKSSKLLITTQFCCYEYNILTTDLKSVIESNNNERFCNGLYVNDDIQLVVTKNNYVDSENFENFSRCETYKRVMQSDIVTYLLSSYYIIPTMPEHLCDYFVYQNGDLGHEGPHNSNGIQHYWITQGFFLEINKEILKHLNIKNYIRKNDEFVLSTQTLKPLEMIFVSHPYSLSYQINWKSKGYTYSYLTEDMQEAIFLNAGADISFITDLSNCKYDKISSDFQKHIGNKDSYAYWDYVVPYKRDKLLGCHSNYLLREVQLTDGDYGKENDYLPGISILGCKFYDISADKQTKLIICQNGGHINN